MHVRLATWHFALGPEIDDWFVVWHDIICLFACADRVTESE